MKTDRESVEALATLLKRHQTAYIGSDNLDAAASLLLALRDELDRAEQLVAVERGNAMDNYNRWNSMRIERDVTRARLNSMDLIAAIDHLEEVTKGRSAYLAGARSALAQKETGNGG